MINVAATMVLQVVLVTALQAQYPTLRFNHRIRGLFCFLSRYFYLVIVHAIHWRRFVLAFSLKFLGTIRSPAAVTMNNEVSAMGKTSPCVLHPRRRRIPSGHRLCEATQQSTSI